MVMGCISLCAFVTDKCNFSNRNTLDIGPDIKQNVVSGSRHHLCVSESNKCITPSERTSLKDRYYILVMCYQCLDASRLD